MTEQDRAVALNPKHIVNTEAAAHLLNVSAVTLARHRRRASIPEIWSISEIPYL
jgi:hypothetical protein